MSDPCAQLTTHPAHDYAAAWPDQGVNAGYAYGTKSCPGRKPQRIQRKRIKGWRMPEGAVYVGRPSKWGNPYRWSEYPAVRWDMDGEPHRNSKGDRQRWSVTDYRFQFLAEVHGHKDAPTREEIRRELAGKDLACWCALGDPCHADVLLEIANA